MNNDWHLQQAHLLGPRRLNFASLSKAEAEYLAKYLGKKGPAPKKPANAACIDFVQAWAATSLDDDERKALRKALKKHARSIEDKKPKRAKKAKAEEAEADTPPSSLDLPVSDKVMASLTDAGLLTAADILEAGADGLIALPSIGDATAAKILDALRS